MHQQSWGDQQGLGVEGGGNGAEVSHPHSGAAGSAWQEAFTYKPVSAALTLSQESKHRGHAAQTRRRLERLHYESQPSVLALLLVSVLWAPSSHPGGANSFPSHPQLLKGGPGPLWGKRAGTGSQGHPNKGPRKHLTKSNKVFLL